MRHSGTTLSLIPDFILQGPPQRFWYYQFGGSCGANSAAVLVRAGSHGPQPTGAYGTYGCCPGASLVKVVAAAS